MSGTTEEQAHGVGEETRNPPKGGRGGKSRDVVAGLEARMVRLEGAMMDTTERLDRLAHGIEYSANKVDARLREYQGEIQAANDDLGRDYLAFQARILGALANLQGEVNAMKAAMEETRADLGICKRAMVNSAGDAPQVGEAPQGSRPRDMLESFNTRVHGGADANGGGDREDCPQCPRDEERRKPTDRLWRRKEHEMEPKQSCFLCEGSHWARDCPKRKELSTIVVEKEDAKEVARLGCLQVLNTMEANKVSHKARGKESCLVSVDRRGQNEGQTMGAMVLSAVQKRESSAPLSKSPGGDGPKAQQKREGHKRGRPKLHKGKTQQHCGHGRGTSKSCKGRTRQYCGRASGGGMTKERGASRSMECYICGGNHMMRDCAKWKAWCDKYERSTSQTRDEGVTKSGGGECHDPRALSVVTRPHGGLECSWRASVCSRRTTLSSSMRGAEQQREGVRLSSSMRGARQQREGRAACNRECGSVAQRFSHVGS